MSDPAASAVVVVTAPAAPAPPPPPVATNRLEHLANMLLEAPWTQILSVIVILGAMGGVAVMMSQTGLVPVSESESKLVSAPLVAGKDYARGLITVLFTVGTIGVALLATLTAMFIPGPEGKERFDRVKEVLSLLLGIVGTIIGFYYGTEVNKKEPSQQGGTPQVQTSPQAPGKDVVSSKLEGDKNTEKSAPAKTGETAGKAIPPGGLAPANPDSRPAAEKSK